MYGDKISQLRKEANLTQGQLGNLLNVSAQAVSKWENNLSEPDLATVKRIASIFNISIDEFLDIKIDSNVDEETTSVQQNKEVSDAIANAVTEIKEDVIGYCTNCGTKVTKDNVGVTSPKILCKKCAEEVRLEEDKKERAKETARLNKKQDLRTRKKKSIIKGSIVAVLVFVFGMMVTFADTSDAAGTAGLFFFFLFVTYGSYAFTAEIVLDKGPIGDILLWFVSRPLRMPGVIFTLDLSGLFFLIFVKLGLTVLSFMLGALLFLVGVFVGLIVAPFSFPFTIHKVNKELK